MKLKTTLKTLLKCAFSVLFFLVLFSFVQGNELLKVFGNVHWGYFTLSFAITMFMVAASCAKWQCILALKNNAPSFGKLFRIYLIGYFFSNILPSTVGGDVVRSWYAGKLIRNQSFSAVAIFVERFSGIFFLFLLVTVAPFFRPSLYSNPYVYYPAIAGGVLTLIVLWVWWAKNPFALPNRIFHFLLRTLENTVQSTGSQRLALFAGKLAGWYQKILEKAQKVREELAVATAAFRQDRGFLVRLLLLTVLFYVFTWINVYVAFLAFNVEVDFLAICALVPAIMLVAHLPVTLLGNLGYFESVFVFYFLLVGVDGAESLAMGLLLRLKMLLIGVIGYGVYLSWKQKPENLATDREFAIQASQKE